MQDPDRRWLKQPVYGVKTPHTRVNECRAVPNLGVIEISCYMP